MNPSVDWFFAKDTKWQDEYTALRTIVLECELKEELKWGCPCYTLNDSNVVLIHGFKDYCALLFMKGSLMKDDKGILIQQTANVQDRRQLRFTTLAEIKKLKKVIKEYIQEAIKIEKSGAKIEFKKTEEFDMPDEFKAVLKEMPDVNAAFKALTPGRQRGYLLHFSAAKQSKTREARIAKYLSKILQGKGLDD
ncbi:MAG TPA: YdeI/OmpD-associated family protein [Bacteroidia bacterium]|jgi:uncharacterized protein YdeI (YjbR/CyaY-like superfamily)|nr:YdeI/OmpD-associated family protein [Bacteroidia bacterium]HQF27549.1 YdeI/OmpD-associated family protein [Bacteroidia bacterium]HQK97455.1 YdeI/OmpD-associated family protein [Bacteroidia bacterium]